MITTLLSKPLNLISTRVAILAEVSGIILAFCYTGGVFKKGGIYLRKAIFKTQLSTPMIPKLCNFLESLPV